MKSWRVSGNATVDEESLVNVKLAAFYKKPGERPILVSNVENMGTKEGDFDLFVDTTELQRLSHGDRIYLIMWSDENDDDLYDLSEKWAQTKPRQSCPVFQEAYFCSYFYAEKTNELMKTQKGWNQSIKDIFHPLKNVYEYQPIYYAKRSGAKIESSSFWH